MKKQFTARFSVLPAGLLLLFAACGPSPAHVDPLQTRIDSLQKILDRTYKPGLGEFMSGIQVHHAKLWFAGAAGNWALADFEIKEIGEAIDDINTYCTDRPEVASLPVIKPALDSVNNAIKNKSVPQFKSNFLLLTNTCNTCHRATHHEFNVIQIPATPPFSNQVFKP